MENMDTGKKWKTNLLKSSLPLEHLIAEALKKKGLDSLGEFAFMRGNENGQPTEFSIDLAAYKDLEINSGVRVCVNLLIECKYSFPDNIWVFSPLNKDDRTYGVFNVFDQLTPFQMTDREMFWKYEDGFRCVSKGVELSHGGSDPSRIRKAISQIRYALPSFVRELLLEQVSQSDDDEETVEIVVPVVVTTARLRTFKDALDMESFTNADTLDDVTEEVSEVIACPPESAEFEKFCADQISLGLPGHIPEIKLKHLREIAMSSGVLVSSFRERPGDGDEYSRTVSGVFQYANRVGENIFIVNYDSFGSFVDEILAVVDKAAMETRRFARNSFRDLNTWSFSKPNA